MNQILKIVVMGICLGLILIIIQKGFRIDEDAFMRGYWKAAPVIVAGAVLLNVLYNLSYLKKMRQVAALLNAGKPKEYIAGVERLLLTARGQHLRTMLTLNLAAGYIEIKQYDRAVDLLEGLSERHLRGSTVKLVHLLDLCLGYFYSEQYDKAMELYHANQKIFEPFRNDKKYGGNIAAVDIFAAITDEQYDRAEKLLDQSRKSWNDPRLQAAFQELGNFLKERKNRK